MRLKVKDVMSKNPIAVLPSDSVQECAFVMQEFNVGVMPIVCAGKFKGMITRKDIISKVIARGLRPKDVKASQIMTQDISFVTPEQRLEDIIAIMVCEKYRKLPVLKDGMFEGVVAVRDVIKYCSDDMTLDLAVSLL